MDLEQVLAAKGLPANGTLHLTAPVVDALNVEREIKASEIEGSNVIKLFFRRKYQHRNFPQDFEGLKRLKKRCEVIFFLFLVFFSLTSLHYYDSLIV